MADVRLHVVLNGILSAYVLQLFFGLGLNYALLITARHWFMLTEVLVALQYTWYAYQKVTTLLYTYSALCCSNKNMIIGDFVTIKPTESMSI